MNFIINNRIYWEVIVPWVGADIIPVDDALNPKIIDIKYTPEGLVYQMEIKLKFGKKEGILHISNFPGSFIEAFKEMGHSVKLFKTNGKINAYIIKIVNQLFLYQ